MRQQYRSLFVKQFNAQEKVDMITTFKLSSVVAIDELGKHDDNSDGTPDRMSRLVTLQQDEGFTGSVKEITENSPIKSPKRLQPATKPKMIAPSKQSNTSYASHATTQVGSIAQPTNPTNTTSATHLTQVNQVKNKAPKQSKSGMRSDSNLRKQVPITTVKKAHINLDGERA
jgi:hypothetical protein